MKNLDSLAALVAGNAEDRWYVTDGGTAVGPVSLELLARGVEAEKVPLDGFVRHETWSEWRRLSDLVVSEPVFDPRATFRMGSAVPLAYAEAQVAAEKSAARGATPPAPAARHLSAAKATAPNLRGAAADLPQSLLRLLPAAVACCTADVALIYDVVSDGAIVVCTQGAFVFEALGTRAHVADPVLLAAQAGHVVVAEPVPGPAGQAIRFRLSKGGRLAEGAFMIPIRPFGRLSAFLEVGRATSFRAAEVAAVEALVEQLARDTEDAGWGEDWLSTDDLELDP